MFLADHVYIPIADLDTKERMFSADIYYHVKCFTKYIQRIKTANASLIPMDKEILEEFFGNSIQFCESDRQNQFSMVFYSSMDITDVINTLRPLDGAKSAARTIREKLRNVDFGLQDKICDAEELKLAWRTAKIPDEVMVFFSEPFNIKKTMLLKDYYNEHDEIDKTEADENNVLKSMKIGSMFQIMFYNLHSGNKRTPLHVMKVVEINERCKSRELITSFNRRGFCISYASMKKHRNDLAKFAIANSSEFDLPIPSHFSPSAFTISAFDNFDYVYKNTLSGKSGSHDTVITLFQEIPTKKK